MNCKNKANYAETEEENGGALEKNTSTVAFYSAGAAGNSMEVEWFVDSGATHHYVNNEEVLMNKRRFEEPRLIQWCNGSGSSSN